MLSKFISNLLEHVHSIRENRAFQKEFLHITFDASRQVWYCTRNSEQCICQHETVKYIRQNNSRNFVIVKLKEQPCPVTYWAQWFCRVVQRSRKTDETELLCACRSKLQSSRVEKKVDNESLHPSLSPTQPKRRWWWVAGRVETFGSIIVMAQQDFSPHVFSRERGF